jgi:glycosyltransferase involved in cell wall biosynthesis
MKLSFYMPFKPPGHKNPSGDLITGMGLYDFLASQGHELSLASRMRNRWIYLKPWKLPQLAWERTRVTHALRNKPPELWFTYHSYYKAPDLLGPYCSKKLSVPYVLFQGIYSTKRRRKLLTLPGFLLNRATLTSARMIFANKRSDELNLKRLVPEERVCYIAPGLSPESFSHDPLARKLLREEWATENRRVVMTTAMLRPGVKTAGVRQVVASCGELKRRGHEIVLIVIGDGDRRAELERAGRRELGEDIRFLGKINREELYRYYSGADVFAFPGIEESLGMVYLEAQSTGLPVVAYSDWGAREAVVHGQTGWLSEFTDPDQFTDNIEELLVHDELRRSMGVAAAQHIRENHDLSVNYRSLNTALENITPSRAAS